MSLIPIPVGRSPNALVSQRLLAQLQADQSALLRVQTQVSTGKRLFVPSDDHAAALRASVLQRSLQQHAQTKVNLTSANSYLTASESAIASVAGVLSDLRAAALGAVGTTVSDTQRAAAAAEVQQGLQGLLTIGNQKFRDRYLFAGSLTSTLPFVAHGTATAYQGNETNLATVGGFDTVLETNRTGQDVFGALSAEVRGTADLDPLLTENTRLADLDGGRGVQLGSIALSDGVNRTVVDLTGAETIGDIIRRIEANPPSDRTVQVSITATGLQVTLVDGVGDGFTIKEVNGGRTAADLGILETSGSLSGVIAGSDLDPQLTLTTRLDQVLAPLGAGSSMLDATGIRIHNGGLNYDISFAAAETVEDVLHLLNGSGAGVVATINAAGTGIDVRSRLSGADFSIGELGGGTAAQLGLRTFTRETTLADLNFGIGVQDSQGDDFTIRRNDGTLLAIDLAGATTIGDVLDRINQHADNLDPGTRVVAQLAAFGNGIELVDDTTAATSTLAVLKSAGSAAAWDLGLVPRNATQSAAAVVAGGNEALTGADVRPLEAQGVFNTLRRLHEALLANDANGIQRAMALLDEDINRTTFARAEIGLAQQNIDLLKSRWDDENIELQARLSDEIDVDLVEAILEMTNRQASYQAALQAAGQTLQMTLLDFL